MPGEGFSAADAWKILAAGVSTSFALLAGFEHDLANLSLELRFIIVGILCLGVELFVAEALRFKKHRGTGFHNKDEGNPSTLNVGIRVAAIIAVAVFSSWLVGEILRFHNIRIVQRPNPMESNQGTIEIQPSHRPTKVTLTMWTPEGRPEIVKKAPGSWNRDDDVVWRIQNDSPSGLTIFLSDFSSPKVFGMWYELSGDAGQLHVSIEPDPADVRVLHEDQVKKGLFYAKVYGGALCVLGLLYWLFRSGFLG
jgi:hypothetical protein